MTSSGDRIRPYIRILPGLPGTSRSDSFQRLMPSLAPELALHLEEAGVEVLWPDTPTEPFEPRGDLLLPILEFVSGVSTGTLSSLLAGAIASMLRAKKDPPERLSVRIEIVQGDQRTCMELEGSVEDVVHAVREID